MRAALLAESYGSAHYGRINGAMSFGLTLARTLAPIGATLLAGQFGGYRRLLWLLVELTLLVAVPCSVLVGQRASCRLRFLPSVPRMRPDASSIRISVGDPSLVQGRMQAA